MNILHHLIENAGQIATLVGAIVGFLGLVFGVVKWAVAKLEKRMEAMLNSTDMTAIAKLAVREVTRQIAPLDPSTYFTFDYRIPGESTVLRAPLIPGLPVRLIPPHLSMLYRDHNDQFTEYQLDAFGDCEIDMHCHSYDETVEVLRGVMTCRRTGRIYRSGEKWDIPRDEFHAVHFEKGTICIGQFRPPLPTAEVAPVALVGMERAFHHPPTRELSPAAA